MRTVLGGALHRSAGRSEPRAYACDQLTLQNLTVCSYDFRSGGLTWEMIPVQMSTGIVVRGVLIDLSLIPTASAQQVLSFTLSPFLSSDSLI